MRYPVHSHGHLGAVGAAVAVARLDGEDPLAVASIAAGTPLLTSWQPCYEGATVRNTFIGYAARPPTRRRSPGCGRPSRMDLGIGMPDTSRDGSSGFPVARNPWHRSRWAGGSSSGSASAVAAGAALGALGADTGGSIRIPAAYCGVTGFAPTFGAVPATGCLPIAHTLDRIGPIAGSARDCALLAGVLTGAADVETATDTGDSTTSENVAVENAASVVVVGSGIAGLSAAVSAAEALAAEAARAGWSSSTARWQTRRAATRGGRPPGPSIMNESPRFEGKLSGARCPCCSYWRRQSGPSPWCARPTT